MLMAVTEEFQNVHTPHDKGYKKSRGGIVCGNKQAVVDEIMAQAGNGDDNVAFEYTFIREFKEELEEMKKQVWNLSIMFWRKTRSSIRSRSAKRET